MAIEVPMETTPIDKREASVQLREAAGELGIASTALPLLLAHGWGQETRRGKSIQNFNWGNISASDQKPGKIWRPTWFTVDENSSARDKFLNEKMLKGEAPRAFRAYDNHREGIRGYLKLLLLPRYTEVMRGATLMKPRDMADAIFESGYCRDKDCQGHIAGPALASLARELAPLFPEVDSSPLVGTGVVEQEESVLPSLQSLLEEPPFGLGERDDDEKGPIGRVQGALNTQRTWEPPIKVDGWWGEKSLEAWKEVVTVSWSRLMMLVR